MPHHDETMARMLPPVGPQTVTPTGSPFSWVSADSGNLIVTGGTVSLLEVGRTGTFVTAGILAGFVPVARGDTVRITYVVAPTISFWKA